MATGLGRYDRGYHTKTGTGSMGTIRPLDECILPEVDIGKNRDRRDTKGKCRSLDDPLSHVRYGRGSSHCTNRSGNRKGPEPGL